MEMTVYSAIHRTHDINKQVEFEAPNDYAALEYVEKNLGMDYTVWKIPA